MNTFIPNCYLLPKSLLLRLMLILMLGFTINTSHATTTIAQSPLFLTLNVTPIVMLNLSKDHQLYFKAFDDYSDLDNDGIAETTYKNSFDYYGYFDSYKCYSYTNSRFEPSSTTTTKYCSGLWSGNFLNWASMARIDTIRKILYGGFRSIDTGITSTTSTNTPTPIVYTSTIPGATTTSHPTPTKSSGTDSNGRYTYTTTATKTLTSSSGCPSTPATVASDPNVYTYTFDYSTTSSGPSSNTSTPTTVGATTTTVNTATTSTITSTSTTTFTSVGSSHHLHTVSMSYAPTGVCTTTSGVSSQNFTITMSVASSETSVANIAVTTVTSTTPATTTTTTTSTTTTTVSNNQGQTILERTYLPNDAHSFAKFYKGSDLTQLTPYTSTQVTNGITLCNTTVSSTQLSQNVTDAPLLRVAMGDNSLWSANERWQCRWSQEVSATNGNVTASSGLSASANNPSNTSSGSGDFNVRVKVCVNGLINTENCKTYPDGTLKPIGLLQTYGDGDLIRFGLMTGSYSKNQSGGVLRKNASSMIDEINVTTDGTFKATPSTGGIVNTLNLLRIHGYRHDDGTYFGVTNSDNCTWGWSSFTEGSCSNWGNPQSEIFLESLRYLSGHSALATYLPNHLDSTYISGLTVALSTNPLSSSQWCAKLNVIQFNASTSSYDGDALNNVSDISSSPMNSLTNIVGAGELISGTSYFVGENGTNNNQLCTAKTVTNLSDVKGTCPDAPRLSGTYHIAGLANFAHNNDIETALQGSQLVTTYGIALSPKVPKLVVPIPSTDTSCATSTPNASCKTVTLLPACQDTSLTPAVPGNCTIVDFKIVHQDCSQLSPVPSGTWNCGKIYVNWEDSEQGGDFDMDMWGTLTYSVSSTQVKITTDVIYNSTPYKMAFAYILSGTSKDGFHAHSGINGYAYTDPLPGTVTTGANACTNCTYTDAASTVTYTVGTGSASSLQQPLYYAAKWGGFIDSNSSGTPDITSEWDSNGDGIPDRYFYSTNPGTLAASLNAALANVIATSASASAVAANSTKLNTGTQIYQAKFNSGVWSGQLEAYNVNTSTGALTFNWDASVLLPAFAARKIYTYNPSAAEGSRGISFLWDNLTTTPSGTSQQDYLNKLSGNNDGNGELRVDWLRGDNTHEQTPINLHGIFRSRTDYLGDIINSDPIYAGSQDYGYAGLASTEGSSYSSFLTANTSRTPMIYVGANDGMLHGFNANGTGGGAEIFAYVPNALFPTLSNLTAPTYSHQYYVDGMSATNDVYYTSAWHTLLAGTTGAGGRAVFALDITNPDTFGTSNALWEFTNTNDADLGYTFAQPSIVRMQDGHWVVIVANGYNSDNGHAVLFILDAKTGAVLQKIDTGIGTTGNKNGLSSPIAVDTNNDLSVDTLYAGDLYGNLWKFDVSGSVGSLPNPSVFFVACTTTGTSCSTANRQPITGKPNVGAVSASGTDQNGVGRMIYFGTGKYFEPGDNTAGSSPQVETFYGLWDKGSAITDRTLLQAQTITFDGIATTIGGTVTPNAIRVVSQNSVCYSAISTGCNSSSTLKNGWTLDLLLSGSAAQGERVVSFPLVRRGVVVFSTLIPSADQCTSGGTSRLMEIDALNGGAFIGGAAFDTNKDGKIDSKDSIKVVINGVSTTVVASGIDLGIGITKTPAVIEAPAVDLKYVSGSSGSMGMVTDCSTPPCNGSSSGGNTGTRRSWQQLK